MCSEISMTWSQHQSTLVGMFKKLLKSSDLVDCTIAAEGQYLKAHKIILSACSPYFEMLFSQESEKNPIVVLKDIKFQELRALIDFIYSGNVKVREEHLERFIGVAESLQIKGLGGGLRKRNTSKQQASESSPPEHNEEDHVSPLHWKRYKRSYTNNKRVNVKKISSVIDVNVESEINQKIQSSVTHVGAASSNGNRTYPFFVNVTKSSKIPQISECSEFQKSPISCESNPTFPGLRESSITLPPNDCSEVCDVVIGDSTSCAEPSFPSSEQNFNSETVVSKNESELIAEESHPDMEAFVEQANEEVIQETLLYSATDETEVVMDDMQHGSSHQYSNVPTATQATYSLSSSATGGKQGKLLLVSSIGKPCRILERQGTVSFGEKAVANRNQKSVWNVVAATSPEDNVPNNLPPLGDTVQGNSGSSVVTHSCNVCKKQFFNTRQLQRHLSLHIDDRPFHCQQCGRSFKQLRTLKVHLSVHSDEKPFLCQLCGRAFRRNSHLQSHMYIHLGHRPFKCHVCKKTYVERSNLKAHMRIHTNDKPFKCPVCGNGFNLSSTLRWHLRTHKSFKCQLCNEVFQQIETLQAHVHIHSTEMTLEVQEND